MSKLTAGMVFLLLLATLPAGASGQAAQVTDRSLLVPGDTVSVIPGGRYDAGGFRQAIFGGGYRELWTTPIRIPVADLDALGGGVTAFRTGGFGQTNTLHFRNPEGMRYTFRSVDKASERGLPPDLRGTLVADIRQDYVSALHPGAALVAAPILEAAGVLHVNPRLYVLPDDPRLGEFRDRFAGMLGYIEERPNEGEGGAPGFAGLTSIVGDERIAELIEEGPDNRVDARAFLMARLVDFLLGDRDRHKGQWRWGRAPGDEAPHRWLPIPEDRDEALIHYDGLLMGIYTRIVPKLVSFGADYPNLAGLSFNGWDLDRAFLPELTLDQWDSVAMDLQARVTDSVIANAVAQLPPEFIEINGAEIERSLRNRRDNMREAAAWYYRFVLSEVEVTATDEDEWIDIDYADDGVSIAVGVLNGTMRVGEYYRRRFIDLETRNIRLYLKGGDDVVTVSGRGSSGIDVRVVGGGGDDRYIEDSSGNVAFFDSRGDNVIESSHGRWIDSRRFRRPPSPAPLHDYAQDWGSLWQRLPTFSVVPDLGLQVGLIATRWRYGFRKVPYANRMTFVGGYAAGVGRGSFAYMLDMKSVAHGVDFGFGVRYTGFETIRYHGVGNETNIELRDEDYFKIDRQTFELTTGLTARPANHVSVSFGPVLSFSDTEREEMTILEVERPLGTGKFGYAGGRVNALLDFRDQPVAASRGFMLTGTFSYFPSVLDVDDPFYRVEGEASAFLSAASAPLSPTLALRGGARKLWGSYPFYEAAYIGGIRDVRGFAEQRFAGDAAAFGNAELRITAGDVQVIVPGQAGFFGLFDAGRVWLSGESSDEIHTAVGGGVWISFLDSMNTLSLGVAHSTERTSFYLRSGFHF